MAQGIKQFSVQARTHPFSQAAFRGSSALALLRPDSAHGIPSSFRGILSTVLATDLDIRAQEQETKSWL